jgi:hypothetical protein
MFLTVNNIRRGAPRSSCIVHDNRREPAVTRSNPFAPSPLRPFAPPLAASTDDLAAGRAMIGVERLHLVASARRRVLTGMHLSFCLFMVHGAPYALPLLVLLSSIVTIRAMVGLHEALDDPWESSALSANAMLLPVINLCAMAVLVWRTSRLLRTHLHELPPFDPLRR